MEWSTSFSSMTASSGTLQNMEIFWRSSLSSGLSQRQTKTCGMMPISRSLATLCCVGFVFNSPDAMMTGEDVDAVFDFVRDVRNDLDGLAKIFSLALVVQHGLINLTAREIVQARELDVGEPLVMAEVEVGFRAVVEHITLAVLIRRHRARINIEIRVEFLQRDLEAAIFEQRAERGSGKTFAERTH